MDCRITNELNEEQSRSERAEKEWIARCPAMRDTAVEIAAGIMCVGRRHNLYRTAFDEGWLDVSDAAEAQLTRCLAVYRLNAERDDVTASQLIPIAEAALTTAIKSLYGNDEDISTLCADGASEAAFIAEILRK